MGGIQLIVLDFIISFMWVCSSILIKMFVYKPLGLGHEAKDEVFKCSFSIVNMYLFALLSKITKGGSYNPLMVFPGAISGDFSNFLFTVGARIPAQVIGSITGLRLIMDTFPEVGQGPRLNIDIHRGALTEGIMSFAIVIIYLGLSAKIPGSFFRKTWISSIAKLTLHVLYADLTGGCINPATVLGWAYARGDHITKEHILVYWIAPIEASLLAVLVFRLVIQPILQEENTKVKAQKSD